MENYELIDNKERHQYEFHIDKSVPRIEYILSKTGKSISHIRKCLLPSKAKE